MTAFIFKSLQGELSSKGEKGDHGGTPSFCYFGSYQFKTLRFWLCKEWKHVQHENSDREDTKIMDETQKEHIDAESSMLQNRPCSAYVPKSEQRAHQILIKNLPQALLKSDLEISAPTNGSDI